MKRMLMTCVAAIAAHCAALADVDSLGKTPTYWYTFDGAIVSHGSSALKCAFDDSNNTFLACRGERKGWRVNPNKSYHHENVFAPNNGSFTIFLSMNPGSGQSNRYIFSLGGNTSTTNLAFVLMFNNRIGVARWDRTRCGTNLRAYGLMAADGVAGRVHPYALVYDGTAHKLTMYSGGVACAEAPFDGFDGADASPTKFQFGSVHGGRVLPFGSVPVSGASAEGMPVIEDFRFYNEALSAEQVASISAELPSTWTEAEAATVGTIENNGEQPRYFYTLDGAVRSRGASNFLSTYNADYPSHSVPSVSSYVECAPDRKAGALSDSSRPHGDWFIQPGGSFTFFVSSTSGTTDQNIIFSMGQHTSTKNLALMRQSSSQVKIVKWNSSSSVSTLVTATVDSPADYVHSYIVRYTQGTGKIELFVDGYKAGEASYDGFDMANPEAFQFGAMRGGNLHGVQNYTGVKMEAIGFYERALTDEEIVALSDKYVSGTGKRIPSDIGRNPEYWYTFTSSGPVKQSTAALPFGSTGSGVLIDNATPVFARNGGYAATELRANNNGSVAGAWGDTLDMSGTFTIFTSARMKKSSNRSVLFSLGKLSESTSASPQVNLAIASTPQGEVSLSRWVWNSNATGTRTDLITTTGLDTVSDFHPYAVVWDGEMLTFYADGTKVGESANFGEVTSRKYQIGSINGGLGSLGFEAGKYAIEDLRIYKTALTAEQVAKISARYAQWPKGALVWNGGSAGSWDYTTANWLSWDAANWRSVTQAFTSGASALFESEVTALDVAAGIVANSVTFATDSRWTTVNSVQCNSLSIADGALVLPANVSGAICPGARLFHGYSSAVYPLDYTDAYGNAYCQNAACNALRFGKPGGIIVIVR